MFHPLARVLFGGLNDLLGGRVGFRIVDEGQFLVVVEDLDGQNVGWNDCFHVVEFPFFRLHPLVM